MDLSKLWLTETALCGVSINHKDRTGALMRWATLRMGIASNGAWARPLVRVCEKLKPRTTGKFFFWLFPHVTSDWVVDTKRKATHGVAQASISRIEEKFGFRSCVSFVPHATGLPLARGKFCIPANSVES